MNRQRLTTFMVLLSLLSLLLLSTACSQAGVQAEVAQVKTPSNTQASADVSDRLTDLESRVKRLEQGLDERVIEYNMVQSALLYMVIDNKLGLTIPYADFTNDMRQFPSPTMPLYGFDKDKDGKPDTNYVPFEKTKWFYRADNNTERAIYQIPDPKLVENLDIGRGKTETLETELHNIQTAVMAMLADSKAGILDASLTGISDLDLVTTDRGALVLSDYITGLNADGTVKSGCKYDFVRDGTITQRPPTVIIPSPPIPSPQKDYETEWHNIQTATMAMLADSTSGNITAGWGIPQTNMHNIQSIDTHDILYLSNYLTGLNGTSVSSGCKYLFDPDGTVTQIKP